MNGISIPASIDRLLICCATDRSTAATVDVAEELTANQIQRTVTKTVKNDLAWPILNRFRIVGANIMKNGLRILNVRTTMPPATTA